MSFNKKKHKKRLSKKLHKEQWTVPESVKEADRERNRIRDSLDRRRNIDYVYIEEGADAIMRLQRWYKKRLK